MHFCKWNWTLKSSIIQWNVPNNNIQIEEICWGDGVIAIDFGAMVAVVGGLTDTKLLLLLGLGLVGLGLLLLLILRLLSLLLWTLLVLTLTLRLLLTLIILSLLLLLLHLPIYLLTTHLLTSQPRITLHILQLNLNLPFLLLIN